MTQMRNVQIIGIGDYKTKQLRQNVDEALFEHKERVSISNITEVNQIKFFSITATPALCIDGQIVCEGEVPSVETIKDLFYDVGLAYPFQKLNNIVVGFDFSSNAESTLRYAMHLAEHFEASIELVHILPIDNTPLANLDFTDVELKKSALRKALKQNVEQLIQHDKKRYQKEWTLDFQYSVLNGTPSTELLQISHSAELMILGTSNNTTTWVGSIAKAVALGAHCPVIFVPQNYKYQGIIKIAYSFTEEGLNEKTLHSISNFAAHFGSVLDFIHIGNADKHDFLQHTIESSIKQLNNVPKIGKFYLLQTKPVLTALIEYANTFAPDMLIIEHNPHKSWLATLFSHSVSEQIVTQTIDVPIFILYHP